MTYTYDDATVSDLHKEAYGFRPGAVFMQDWKGMSSDAKQGMWDFLCSELEREMEREKLAQERSLELWTNLMFKQAKENNITFSEAICQDVKDANVGGDIGYYCFQQGISYEHEAWIKALVESRSLG
jgi:hypothetical protein